MCPLIDLSQEYSVGKKNVSYMLPSAGYSTRLEIRS